MPASSLVSSFKKNLDSWLSFGHYKTRDLSLTKYPIHSTDCLSFHLYTMLLFSLSRDSQILNYIKNCSLRPLPYRPPLSLFVCLKAIHGVS